MSSVVQDWVADSLTWKQQTVLFTALRGPDALPKDNPAKRLCKFVRHSVLHNADPKTEFIAIESSVKLENDVFAVVSDHDGYPHHFLMHLIHTAEIIGYCHPDKTIKDFWHTFYFDMCNAFHMHPETLEELNERLK